MSSIVEKLTRKKYLTFDNSPLPRVLTLFDLTALGIGSTVGVGFYILAGEVARNTAGPAVTISFLIAGIASVFSGICYAEFGARVPKAGSAYVYSYVCVGEFIAFIIGWNLILEYVIGTASVARGYSAYIDDLANNKMSEAFNNSMHMNVDALSPYPDFFALGMTLILTIILIVGVKESSRFNNVFTGVNIFVILYVIIAGSTQADPHNWGLSESEVQNTSICSEPKSLAHEEESVWGTGGFAPYGFNGIMQGAATCFFGFVGFDIIATTGEEALRPERNIPLAISMSLFVVFAAYFGMSTVLTLALPYCMEDPDAPLIELFEVKDMQVSKWIVSVGAIFGFSASLLGAMFPMPRIIYAMADDGILFRFLSRINKRFKTPLIATVLSGIFAGTMALIFDLESLVDMMSIGTLMAYTIVSVCVMLLRYTPDSETDFMGSEKLASNPKKDPGQYSFKDYVKQLLNRDNVKEPTPLTSSLVNYATITFCAFCFLLTLFLTLFGKDLINGDAGAIVLVVIFFVLTLLNLSVIAFQPTSKKVLTFKVPFVPWIPAASSFINLYLMCNLTTATWIRFGVWMAIGLAIYFFYGIRESTGSEPPKPIVLEGIDNEGMNYAKEKIPPIYVVPPTPRMGDAPTTTVRPLPPRRLSVIESSLVQGEEKKGVEVVVVPGVVSDEEEEKLPHQSNFQSFDISPPQLEPVSESSSESESDGEDKLESTKVVTVATVYSSHNGKDDSHPIPKEEELKTQTGADADATDLLLKGEIETWEGGIVSETKDDGKASAEEDTNIQRTSLNTEESDGKTEISEMEKEVSLPSDTRENETPLNRPHSLPLDMSVYNPSPVSSSEPGSPRIKQRHPFKVLVRASSFENVPPSPVNSPLAMKVKKFTIIPVTVPPKTGENETETPSSTDGDVEMVPPPTLETSPKINFPAEYHSEGNVNMLSDLKSRLTKLEKHNQQYEITGSTDAEGTDTQASSDYLTPNHLDTIRERGESKIQAEDVSQVNKNNLNSSSNAESSTPTGNSPLV